MRQRSTLLDLAIVIAFAAAAFLFWKLHIVGISPPEVTHVGIATTDLFTQIYPMADAAARSIRSGTLPLWNPYQGAGHPFLASVLYGVLYPLNFFYLLLPTHLAMEATIVLHFCVAALFMYLYARTIRLGRIAAVAAGLTFMGSAAIMDPARWFPPAVSAAVWLPLAFLGIERIFDRRRFFGAALLGLAVGMSLLAGWLQTWMYSMYAITLYSGIRVGVAALRGLPPRTLARIVVLLGAGIVLGLGLAAAQLLPSLELRGLGPRRAGGLTVVDLVRMGTPAFAELLGNAVNPEQATASTYLGILAVILIPVSAFAPVGRVRVLTLWVIAVGALLVALTIHTPFFEWFLAIPTAGWFRVPQRILFLYGFAGSVLVGIGVDAVGDARAWPRRRCVAAHGAATGLALLLAWTAPVPPLGFALLGAGLVTLWLAALHPAPVLRSAALVFLVLLLGADLLQAKRFRGPRPYHDASRFDSEGALLDAIRENQDRERTYFAVKWAKPWMMPKQGTLRGINSMTDYEPLSLDREARLFRLMEEPEPAMPHNPFFGFVLTRPERPHFRLIDLMSVRFMVVSKYDRPFRAGIVKKGWRPFRAGKLWGAFRNPRTLPRSYVAHRVIPVRGDAAALAALASPSFDFWKTAVIESEEGELGPLPPAPTLEVTPARIRLYEPNRVEIDVRSPAPGYLVLTDTFYPGWTATVDGSPQPILRANYLFRAVRLSAGKHRVSFVYAPRSFALGAGIALTTAAGLVVWAVRSALRQRRRGQPA